MQITANSVVSFHYTLHDDQGNQLERSAEDQPSAYLHGAGNIIRGLETAMTGRSAGDNFSVNIAPVDAYGSRNDNSTQRVPIKHLLYRGKLKPGMAAHLNTKKGQRPVTVTKVGRHSVDIDTNHPLAGQHLCFDVTITDVRAASAEEIAHGHVHGAGGHQH